MSRLSAQKRRLRAFQREEGIIAPDDLTIDKESFEQDGTSHAAIDEAAEAGEPHNAHDHHDEKPAGAKKKVVKRKAPKRR